MNLSNGGYMGVADLRIDDLNGHPVWMYGFLSVRQNFAPFFCKSRVTGASTILHDLKVIHYLFEPIKEMGLGAKLAVQGLRMATGVKISQTLMPDAQAHKLILDIRGYVESAYAETPTQGERL